MNRPTTTHLTAAGRSSQRQARRAAGVALVIACGALLAGCLFPPIDPNNRPGPLVGQTNGRIDPSLLSTVTPDCSAYVKAAPSLRAMMAAAQAAGVNLQPAECYRTYEMQYFYRWYWCTKGMCQMAAVPGTSIHGWGKAADWRADGASMDFGSRGYEWMKANAWAYGWNHPGWAEQGQSAAEAWHWEWVGDGGTMYPGTTIGPQA